MPNIEKTKKMLQMMDLVVVLDTMPSDTCMMADVILPECTYLEREDMVVSFNRLEPSLALRNQVIKPLYESRSMQDILKGLGKKLSKPLFEVSAKYDEELQESIKTLGKEKAYIQGGYDLSELYKYNTTQRNRRLILKQFSQEVYESLKTKGVWYPYMDQHKEIQNGRFQYYPEDKKYYTVKRDYKVKCFLKKLAKNGDDAMPTWHDHFDFKVAKDSFRLITGRYIFSTQTATANNRMLKDIEKTNHIWINDRVAKKLSIVEGDNVAVSSSIGSVVIKAYPTNKIAPDVVWFAHGFGIENEAMSNAYGKGASDNVLIEDRYEKVYGCSTMHETDVQIRKL
jgi:thiosulfate reductase/polysulfide reductase chain A